jgi:hypothetical protein
MTPTKKLPTAIVDAVHNDILQQLEQLDLDNHHMVRLQQPYGLNSCFVQKDNNLSCYFVSNFKFIDDYFSHWQHQALSYYSNQKR